MSRKPRKQKKIAKIIEPKPNSVFGFDEIIEFRAKAVEKTKDGDIDISHCIEWRKPAQQKGPIFKMSFANRKNATIAIYLNGVHQASITLKIICKSCAVKPPLTPDEKQLARIIMAEGVACSAEERSSIGYAVVNRYRFFPLSFRKTLDDVIHQKGQFKGITNDIYRFLKSESSIETKLDRDQCRIYRETLCIAREILADVHSANEIIFENTGKHAFYFNKAVNDPPGKAKSPVIYSKTISRWGHSFYGFVN